MFWLTLWDLTVMLRMWSIADFVEGVSFLIDPGRLGTLTVVVATLQNACGGCVVSKRRCVGCEVWAVAPLSGVAGVECPAVVQSWRFTFWY
jgi:hypothetical protein